MAKDGLVAPPHYTPEIETDTSAEQEDREHLNFLIFLLCLHSYRYASAVSLIRHCEKLTSPEFEIEAVNWMGVAARDAALSIYHFGRAQSAIPQCLRRCPSLLPEVDAKKLREASKSFSRKFPDAIHLRHAVAHLAEQLSTRESIARLRRPGEFLIWESQVGGTLSMASPRGRQVQLSVNDQSLAELNAILFDVCAAFEGAKPTWTRNFE